MTIRRTPLHWSPATGRFYQAPNVTTVEIRVPVLYDLETHESRPCLGIRLLPEAAFREPSRGGY